MQHGSKIPPFWWAGASLRIMIFNICRCWHVCQMSDRFTGRRQVIEYSTWWEGSGGNGKWFDTDGSANLFSEEEVKVKVKKWKVKVELMVSGLTLMEAQTYFLRRKCSDCEGKRRIVEQKRGGISLNKLTEQNDDDDCYFEQKDKFSDWWYCNVHLSSYLSTDKGQHLFWGGNDDGLLIINKDTWSNQVTKNGQTTAEDLTYLDLPTWHNNWDKAVSQFLRLAHKTSTLY